MATRKIKDAKDLTTNELIYFKSHAKATYLSDGRTVEDVINNINISTNSDISGILNIKDLNAIREAQLSLEDKQYKTYIITDDNGNYPSPSVETVYLDNANDLMDLIYRGNDLALRHIIENGEAYYKYLGTWSSENIKNYVKVPTFNLQTAKVGDLITIIRYDFDSDEFYSKYIDFDNISNSNTAFQLFKNANGYGSQSDGEFIKYLIRSGQIYSAASNPQGDSSVTTYPLAIDGKVQFYTAQITPNTQNVYSGKFWTGNMTGPGIYMYVNNPDPAISDKEEGEMYIGYVSPDGTQTLVSMKNPTKTYVRSNTSSQWVKVSYGIGKNTGGTGEIFNDYTNNVAHSDHGHAEGQSCKAVGWNSHAEGFTTTAGTSNTGNAHSEGNTTQALGNNSHSEGINTKAEGHNSHTEGDSTQATNWNAHAEGYQTIASGNGAHAEGNSDGFNEERWNIASGFAAHTEGGGTVASGDYSHAEGVGTQIDTNGGHVQGRFNYNIAALHVVGIGQDLDNTKDAHVITEDGKHYILGVGGFEGTDIEDTTQDLATVIENLKSNVPEGIITQIKTIGGTDITGEGNVDLKTVNGESILGTGNINTTPTDGSITTAKLADNSVTTVKIADGNVTKEKLSESLQNILDILYKVNVSLSGSKNAKKGTTATGNLIWSVTVNGTAVNPTSQTLNEQTLDTSTRSYVYSVTSDTTYTLVVDGVTRQAYIKFYNPVYYGAVSENYELSNNTTGLTELSTYGTKSNNISTTLNNQKFVYLYPSSFGDLTSIKDGNGFEYLSDFTKVTNLTINGESYIGYIKNSAATATITFKFS